MGGGGGEGGGGGRITELIDDGRKDYSIHGILGGGGGGRGGGGGGSRGELKSMCAFFVLVYMSVVVAQNSITTDSLYKFELTSHLCVCVDTIRGIVTGTCLSGIV